MAMHEAAGDEFGESAFLEAELFRDDLETLYRQQFGDSALHIPDDFAEPSEVILAGTYQTADNIQAEVAIFQRVDERGPNYLLRQIYGDDTVYYVVDSAGARSVWHGMPELPFASLRTLRDIMRPGIVSWNQADAHRLANTRQTVDPYAYVRYFAGVS